MKQSSRSFTIVKLGEFISPPKPLLRSIPDEAAEKALREVWLEVGPCLASPKYDGWRFQVHKQGERINLFSRTGKDYARAYASIAEIFRTQIADDEAILDIELVGFDQNGQHLEPSKLLYAPRHRCYLLDTLYLNRRSLISLPTQEREAFTRKYLQDACRSNFNLAEYTRIDSQQALIRFYQECRKRRKEGFDGAIIKPLSTPYFADILKLKAEDTIDAVVIGAYRDEELIVQSLLLAVPSHKLKLWIPVAKVTRTNTDWNTIWTACQPHIVDHRPLYLDEISEIPEIWITPNIVVEITMTEPHSGKGYLVRAEYPRKCTLREDKGAEDATSLEQILRIADLTELMKTLSVRAKRKQLSLFDEYVRTDGEYIFDEEAEKVKSFEESSPMEVPMLQNNSLHGYPIQLSLFE